MKSFELIIAGTVILILGTIVGGTFHQNSSLLKIESTVVGLQEQVDEVIALGAPKEFIARISTTTPATDFGFAVGTSTTETVFGTTTLMTYGSTTLQQWDSGIAFRILDSATSTIFSVNADNALTTVTGDFTVTGTCTGCSAGGGAAFAWTPYADGVATSTLLRFDAGFISQASSTISSSLALNGALTIDTDDGGALGASGLAFSDLFLASGGVINFNAGDVLITHSANDLAFTGVTGDYSFDDTLVITGNVQPNADDGGTLGLSGTEWSDLFLNTGGVINWEAGDITLTHSANTLTFGGGTFDFGSQSMTNVNIDSGTINGITDLAIADGGTGVSSFTDKQLVAYDGSTLISTSTVYFNHPISFNATSTATIATTSASGFYTFANAGVLYEVTCQGFASDTLATSTINWDVRTETTSQTAGSNILSESKHCGSGSNTASTTGFTTSSFSAGDVLNWQIVDAEREVTGVSGQSGLTVIFKFKEALTSQ